MIELLMLLTLSPLNSQPALTAQVQPCVWPNPCIEQQEAITVAEYEICVWPRKCGDGAADSEALEAAVETAPVQLAQVQPCVWPNPCTETPMQVAQIQPCVWPNPCTETPKKETELI